MPEDKIITISKPVGIKIIKRDIQIIKTVMYKKLSEKSSEDIYFVVIILNCERSQ